MNESMTDDERYRDAIIRRASRPGAPRTLDAAGIADLALAALDDLDNPPAEPEPRRGIPGSMAQGPGPDPREGYEAKRAEIQRDHDALMARYNLPPSIAPALRPERTGRI